MDRLAFRADLQGQAKLDAVTALLDKLTEDLGKQCLTPDERDAALDQLKIYGRDPRNADPIFTRDGIETLAKFALESDSRTTCQNALKCLANAMLLVPSARQTFVDLGYGPKACDKLKNDDWEDEFLASRVTLLSTYSKTINLTTLIDETGVADNIAQRLAKHAEAASKQDKEALTNPMQVLSLTEITRLLFNLTHLCHEKASAFTATIPHLLVLLSKHDIPTPSPLEAPMGPFINALLNLELESPGLESSLFPDEAPGGIAARMLELLEQSLQGYPDHELEATVTPLVSVIHRTYARAPEEVSRIMRRALLPSEKDREGVLGQGDSTSAKLLQNLSNPLAPTLRKAISDLLFGLSGNDPTTLVKNIGYGFASGILFEKKLPIPEDIGNPSTSEADASRGRAFNPVTGQFVDSEKPVDEPEMTEEEKEREAERLFVLFERLKKTGIVDVQNPVEQALRDGRFAEIDDKDRVEELD